MLTSFKQTLTNLNNYSNPYIKVTCILDGDIFFLGPQNEGVLLLDECPPGARCCGAEQIGFYFRVVAKEQLPILNFVEAMASGAAISVVGGPTQTSDLVCSCWCLSPLHFFQIISTSVK